MKLPLSVGAGSPAVVIVPVILIVIIALLSRPWVRAIMYDKVPILFPNGEDGDVFLIHVDDDLNPFLILRDMLEGTDPKIKKYNKKKSKYQRTVPIMCKNEIYLFYHS